MKTICLSGWGQAHDALRSVAPHATHVDYPAHAPRCSLPLEGGGLGGGSNKLWEPDDVDSALLAICDAAVNAKLVIGWSMGGRMAVQAIAKGWLKPAKLVLIGTPYQFVQTTQSRIGMGMDTYQQFRDNFALNAQRTLNKAHLLVAKGDSNEQAVKHFLQSSRERLKSNNWLAWLEALAQASCEGMDFSGFPPTLLIHGAHDAVVDCSQAALFARFIPRVQLEIIPRCGHAPHWHDENYVRKLIEDFAHV